MQHLLLARARFARVSRLAPLTLATALSACATTAPPPSSPPPAAAASAPAAPAAAASASAGAAPALRPFAEVVKDARRDDGFVPVWRKDEKAWLELPQDRIGQPFLLSVNVSSALGERGLYASQMGPSWMAEFRRVGNQLQLIARNTDFRASPSSGNQTAVAQAFPESLIAATPVLSQPHPERKSVLVDASFLIADLPGYSTQAERAFRLTYSLDKAQSFFESTRAEPGLTTLGVRAHFATPRIPAPPLTPPPMPNPPPPATAPDARSFFVGFVVNLMALPEPAMRPRLADPRLGHFTNAFTDLGSDLKANPRVHHVNRWRLEKSDPSAVLSEPKKPIVFWLDKNIPPRYRDAVRAGVLEWNKAFEKIGFKNAVQAQQQPDDATWDNMDAGHASVRWFVGADVGFAIGPSHSDPRTGEIVDADIGMSDVFGRGARRFIVEDVAAQSHDAAPSTHLHRHDHTHCNYSLQLAQEMHFALDLLEARGEIQPDSPEADAFVQAAIKDVMMHEVGHTLGLKHNFKASTTITRAQLQDKAFTEAHGISGSVMDYNPYNIAAAGERQASFSNTTLGAYDHWAIEYAYKPIEPAAEVAELARIAGRSTEPALAYADDADAGAGSVEGIDPTANRFDLGDDSLAYYRKRLQLSREMWQRAQDRKPQAGDDPIRQRRVVAAGFRQLRSATELLSKYVGGVIAVRDVPGTHLRAAYTPVEPARQREALQLLAQGFFSADSFRFRPEFLAGLSPDYNEWDRGGPLNIAALVQQTQVLALDRVLAAGTAQRLLDLPLYLNEAQRRNAISLAEVYGTLNQTVWSELKTGSDIDRLRRNLQREHLKRIQTLLTKGSPSLPADALSLVRYHANQLRSDLQRAAARNNLSVETRAHLQDSLSGLAEALKASMSRG